MGKCNWLRNRDVALILLLLCSFAVLMSTGWKLSSLITISVVSSAHTSPVVPRCGGWMLLTGTHKLFQCLVSVCIFTYVLLGLALTCCWSGLACLLVLFQVVFKLLLKILFGWEPPTPSPLLSCQSAWNVMLSSAANALWRISWKDREGKCMAVVYHAVMKRSLRCMSKSIRLTACEMCFPAVITAQSAAVAVPLCFVGRLALRNTTVLFVLLNN